VTQREKVLIGAVAATGVLWGAMRGFDRYRETVAANEGLAQRAADELDDAEFAVQRGEKAKRQLIEWSKRSLPTNADVAKSLYQDWIRSQLAAAGLTVEQVSDKTLNRANPNYGELSLEARASGTLEQLTDFLYKFYAAPHLHRISAATITPSENGAKLAVILGIDAISLSDSERTSELATGEEQSLPQSLDELRTSLASRNVFKPHQPGAVAEDSGANDAWVSAFTTYGDDGYLLWIKSGEPPKTRRFRVGSDIQYGKFSGKIVEIDFPGRRVIIETADGRVEVGLDQNLGQAKPLSDT
jgi:hypothetical protein